MMPREYTIQGVTLTEGEVIERLFAIEAAALKAPVGGSHVLWLLELCNNLRNSQLDSQAVEDGRLFQAMCDLEWHGAGHPTIWTRGTHVNWTEVVGEHVFNIDEAEDRKRLIAWGDAMRNRVANAPKPEPAPRVEP